MEISEILDQVVHTEELAELAGISPQSVRRLSEQIINAGYGKRSGKQPIYHIKTVEWIKNRVLKKPGPKNVVPTEQH